MGKSYKINPLKVLVVIIAIILIVFLIKGIMGRTNKTTENVITSSEKEQNVVVENNVQDKNNNVTTEVKENNEVKENKNEIKEENNVDEENKEDDEKEIVNDPLLSKEEKAIALVKKEWGNTDGVYFSKIAINSRGNYIVSVNDSSTSKSLAFYEVDVDNGTANKK